MQLSVMEAEGAEFASQEQPPDVQTARMQMKELLLAAVASLPEAERHVYQLRELDSLDGEETAAALRISLPAMKSRLHRARAGVRTYLDRVLAPQISRQATS